MPDGFRGRLGDRDPVTLLSVAVFGALCLTVLAIGVVATAAELLNTWRYYFLLERTVAVVTPVATALFVAAVVVGVGAAARV